MNFIQRHWQLIVAIFILTFPLGLFGFFRFFAENTYVLPTYLEDFSIEELDTADSCGYAVPYNFIVHQSGYYADSVDCYVLSASFSEKLDSIIQQTQQLLHKKQNKSCVMQRLVINQACALPLEVLFPKGVPSTWVVLVDKRGYVRSCFSLTGEKGDRAG